MVDMPWWVGKEEIRHYLKKINENGKVGNPHNQVSAHPSLTVSQVLEYTLFQPGLFLDYLASPYQTAKHVAPLDTVFDFQNRRAIVVDGHEEAVMTFTTAADLAALVARAVDYDDGEWPEVSGIRGNRVTASQVIEIGEKIRGEMVQTVTTELGARDNSHHTPTIGSPFAIDKVKIEDLEAGILQTSWKMDTAKKHAAVSDEESAALFKTVTIGMLLSSVKGAWDVSDELNQLFPDYQFEKIEAFLTRVWGGKP